MTRVISYYAKVSSCQSSCTGKFTGSLIGHFDLYYCIFPANISDFLPLAFTFWRLLRLWLSPSIAPRDKGISRVRLLHRYKVVYISLMRSKTDLQLRIFDRRFWGKFQVRASKFVFSFFVIFWEITVLCVESLYHKDSTAYCRITKVSLNFLSLLFVIRVNLLYP